MIVNWARNIAFTPATLDRPTSVAEVQLLVARADRARVLGTGHSFNPIADTQGTLLSVADLPRVLDLDSAGSTAVVSGGLPYGEFTAALDAAGLALPNLGSLPHISIAGACATGTHGSGAGNRVLADSVQAVELVLADGSLRTFRRGDSEFPGAVLALGALGVVTRLWLDLVPSYELRQWVYEGLTAAALRTHFDEIVESAYSVSVFTDLQPESGRQAWLKARDPRPEWLAGEPWLGAVPAGSPRHPVPGVDGRECTEQLGILGPWYQRLPHFRLEFTPSRGDELQSEFFVPREHGPAALAALEQLAPLLAPVLVVSELRTIAADELWLSPHYQRANVGLHFTWVPDAAAVAPVVATVEAALEPFAARPHWGKVFSLAPATVAGGFSRLADFVALRRELDPAGKFGNPFVDRYLGD